MGPIESRLTGDVDAGRLRADEAQLIAAKKLDELIDKVEDFRQRRGLFLKRKEPPRGIYMWGGVGRGKSMLMDWFFEKAPNKHKRRVHFHAFMLDVHSRIGTWRKLDQSERRASDFHVRGAGDDPIAPVAKSISAEARLLCFDEFHVTNIADAMILSRLFEALWRRGVIVVATSNREPERLYWQGLNRSLFLPFIDLLKEHMHVHELGGDEDHRLRKLQSAPVYYAPLDDAARAGLETAWKKLTSGQEPAPTILSVQGRDLELERTASGVAFASFDELCNAALGAADYLEIAQTFHTLILADVPQMEPEMRNEAKRFVTLIDALYEAKTNLIVSAAVSPEKLYEDGTEAFEFERTVSRLTEMQGTEYLAARKQMPENMEG